MAGLTPIIPWGLNTDRSAWRLRPGEADIATNVDLVSTPGHIKRRAGTALLAESAGGDLLAGSAVTNAFQFTDIYGDLMVCVKTAAGGMGSLLNRNLYPTDHGHWHQWPAGAVSYGFTAGDPGTFFEHGQWCYYLNVGGQARFSGGATTNIGLGPPTGVVSLTTGANGNLDGHYFWAVSGYDAIRKLESNILGLFPDPPQAMGFPPTLGSEATAALITKMTLSKAAGDVMTHGCLWRTLGDQPLVYDDGAGILLAGPTPLYRVVGFSWDGTGALALSDGFADIGLDRSETAPYYDNCRPPAGASFGIIHGNYGVYVGVAGWIVWSKFGQPEAVPFNNNWAGASYWRPLHGQEHYIQANEFAGPVSAMGVAGGQLMFFTTTASYYLVGGEVKVLQRASESYGCIGPNAVAESPGGQLYAMCGSGLILWPGGMNISQSRLSEIVSSANAAQFGKVVVGHHARDDAIMVAIPAGSATKANTVYVLSEGRGTDDRTIAKWLPAWAGTDGITKILSVRPPNGPAYTLFFTDTGKVYQYPSTNADAGSNFAASYQFYVGPEVIEKGEGKFKLRFGFGTLGAGCALSVTAVALSYPSQVVTASPAETFKFTAADTLRVCEIGPFAITKGKPLVRVTISSPADAIAWEIQSIEVTPQHG